METQTKLNESPLSDDYPVYWSYLYVCDGKVIKSDIEGTVKDLKEDLRIHFDMEAKEVKNCDIIGRNKLTP